MSLDVLDSPLVAAGTAGGVKTEDERIKSGGYDNTPVSGAVTVEFLLFERPFVTMAPRVRSTFVMACAKDWKGVAPISIVLAAGIHLKARHIFGTADIARVAIAAVITIVAGAGVVHQKLQVLISVIVLLGLHTQRHTELGADKLIVGLGSCFIEVTGTGHGLITVFIISGIIGRVFIFLDGDVLNIERAAAGHAGACGDGAVRVRQAEAALVQDLEAVLAGGAVLVQIGSGARGVLGHLHLTAVVGGIEGQLAHFFREVHSCNGAQTYRAVLYRLSR